MTSTRVCLLGADGRMGSMFARHLPERFTLVGGVVCAGNGKIGRTFAENGIAASDSVIAGPEAMRTMLEGSDVLVSFSSPAAEESLLPLAAKMNVPIVSGTTGHTEARKQALDATIQASTRAVVSANFSPGVLLLLRMLGAGDRVLGLFSACVIDIHHSQKKDAPSGTAVAMRDALQVCPRKSVPIASVRVGDVVGQHEVMLSGRDETITIRHEVHSRRPFVEGAYLSCEWVTKPRPNGIYTFADVMRGEQE